MSVIVLVPHLNGIEPECECGLRQLEMAGIKVWRRCGSSQIDVARNEMLSEGLHENFKAMFFIDADIGFEVSDAFKLINSHEPVVSGVYAKKGVRQIASVFPKEIKEVVFGIEGKIYPLIYAATGFLRIQATILTQMIEKLKLPLCNLQWGRGIWPFFHPLITDKLHYLGEDWAFSHRLHQIGVIPMADTTIKLQHWGRHPYRLDGAIRIGESK